MENVKEKHAELIAQIGILRNEFFSLIKQAQTDGQFYPGFRSLKECAFRLDALARRNGIKTEGSTALSTGDAPNLFLNEMGALPTPDTDGLEGEIEVEDAPKTTRAKKAK